MLTLKDLSTRELMSVRKNTHGWDWPGDEPFAVGQRVVAGGAVEVVTATLGQVLDELNTRPHVPSKKEAKVIRRLRAQTGQSEEWLRAHAKYGQEIADAQWPNRRIVTKQWAEKMAIHYGVWFGRLFKIGE